MVLHVDRNGNEVRTTYNVDGNPVLETGTDQNGENRVTRSFEYDASGNVRKAVAGGFCYTYEYRPDGKLLKKSASGNYFFLMTVACFIKPCFSTQTALLFVPEDVYKRQLPRAV